jgi:dynein heavy chain, axonemal
LFLTYGEELEEIKGLYEKEKQDPPLGRNYPPVAGNIQWSKLLLERYPHNNPPCGPARRWFLGRLVPHGSPRVCFFGWGALALRLWGRCEAPMRRFEDNPAIEGCREYKRIVKTYNRLVRTLVAFEILWFQAWCQAIDKAKAGLSATLVVRHPEDDNLYVNFDPDLFQVVREARCLERMQLSMPIPEAARVLVLQEAKFKRQYSHLVTLAAALPRPRALPAPGHDYPDLDEHEH